MRIWLVMDGFRWSTDQILRGSTPALGGGIGGAEAMAIGMAYALMAHGHDVVLWAPTERTTVGLPTEVCWADLEGLKDAHMGPDVVISSRHGAALTLPIFSTSLRVLWLQDTAPDPWLTHDQFLRCLDDTDGVMCMSGWHCQSWQDVYPKIRSKPTIITAAGLDPAWIVDGPHDRETFIYGSRPERGLRPLLQMWPRIKARIPAATLIVTGYSQGVRIDTADAMIAELGDPSIEIARSDDKPGFFTQLARARLLLYPGEEWFYETCGHVAEDAMAAGVIPLVSHRGALSETVPIQCGTRFVGDAFSPEYQQAFIDEVVHLSNPKADDEVRMRRAVGRTHVLPRCSYASIADHWIETFETWQRLVRRRELYVH
jgi:glycosyltransferase involved in cell wall biosynthesis